jgi:signal transduction histidine kinase
MAAGHRFGQFVTMGHRIRFAEFCRQVLDTAAKQTCEIELGRNEELVYAFLEGVPASEGNNNCSLRVTVTDITERKRAESDLLQAKGGLEQRVYERTTELQAANRVLGESHESLHAMNTTLKNRAMQLWNLTVDLTQAEDRERRRIAQILHDDLQQILVAAKYAAGTLSGHIFDETVQSELNHIKDLLDQSILTSRSLTTELVPPMLYEKGLPDALRFLARWMKEKHGLEVILHANERPEEVVQELRVLLFQSIRELLFNVAKHANVNSAKLTLCYGDDDVLAASVQDEGSGFDPQAPELASGRINGGLGLTAIRERLSAMGGRLEIDSAPGRGTTTTIILPIRFEKTIEAMERSNIASRPIPVSIKAQAGLHRIIVVDDHPIVRKGLIQALRECPGIEVVGEAEDGQKAVEYAKLLHPDVMLMDVNMPRMNGIEATRIIHRDLPGIRVVGLSMHNPLDAGRAMLEAGAVSYLPKDSPVENLLAAIQKI